MRGWLRSPASGGARTVCQMLMPLTVRSSMLVSTHVHGSGEQSDARHWHEPYAVALACTVSGVNFLTNIPVVNWQALLVLKIDPSMLSPPPDGMCGQA